MPSTNMGPDPDIQYVYCILPLDDRRLYTCSEVANHYFPKTRKNEARQLFLRNLHALIRKRYPKGESEHRPCRWYGRTFKSLLRESIVMEAKQQKPEFAKLADRWLDKHVPKPPPKEPKPYQDPPPVIEARRRMRWFMGIAVMSLLIALVWRIPDFMVLTNEGLSAFGDRVDKNPESPNTLYKQAFKAYRETDLEKARDLLDELRQQPIESKLEADSFYLEGAIHRSEGNLYKALDAFNWAQVIYEDLDKPANIYLTAIEKAHAHTCLGDLRLVREQLSVAKKVYEEIGETNYVTYGDYLYQRAHLLRMKGDAEGAIHDALKAREFFDSRKELDTLVGCENLLAGLYLETGQIHEGVKHISEAQRILANALDERRAMDNLVNLCLLARRLGEPDLKQETQILAWAAKHNDQQLVSAVDRIQSMGPLE